MGFFQSISNFFTNTVGPAFGIRPPIIMATAHRIVAPVGVQYRAPAAVTRVSSPTLPPTVSFQKERGIPRAAIVSLQASPAAVPNLVVEPASTSSDCVIL
jgi:hypothetical protein